MSRLIPIVTEKSYEGVEKRRYTFKVPDGLAKPEIAKQVSEEFGVTVTDVRTLRRPGKTRTRGRHKGYRPGFKKAVVELKEGDTIGELAGGSS